MNSYTFHNKTQSKKHTGSLPRTNHDTPIQQRIYNELLELKELKPQDNGTSRKAFFSNFDWSDTTLSLSDEQQEFEEILIVFHDFFLPDIVLI